MIGGSASGFFTASLLARAGCAVEVLERSDQLDPTPRTLIVTSHMRTLLGQVGETSVVNEIRKFELFTDGRAAQIPLDRPDLIIERSRLIRDLAGDAQSHGAKISFGNRFVNLQSNGNGLRVNVERAPGRPRRGTARRRGGRRRRRAIARGPERRMAPPAHRTSRSGHRARARGHVAPFGARLVRAGRYPVLLLADPGIERARGFGFDRRGRPGNPPLPRALHGEARVHGAWLPGRANPGVRPVDSGRAARGSGTRVPGGRCRRASESFDGGRDRHRISRRHRRHANRS